MPSTPLPGVTDPHITHARMTPMHAGRANDNDVANDQPLPLGTYKCPDGIGGNDTLPSYGGKSATEPTEVNLANSQTRGVMSESEDGPAGASAGGRRDQTYGQAPGCVPLPDVDTLTHRGSKPHAGQMAGGSMKQRLARGED